MVQPGPFKVRPMMNASSHSILGSMNSFIGISAPSAKNMSSSSAP
jgi:hypothetical protein